MQIIGKGAYVPMNKVDNNQIVSEEAGQWTEDRLGIKSRRFTYSKTSMLGSIAALRAIENAGLNPSDINMIIVATSTPDLLTPSTAILIQDKIEARNAVVFDINAVCSGFVYAMSLAESLCERYNNILIIGADTFTSITDWKDRNCVFFGDGAGAVVVQRGGYSRSKIYSDAKGKDAFTTRHEGTFKMDGRAVYNAGTTLLPKVIEEVMWGKEIDYLIPHQASIGMLRKLAELTGIEWGKVLTNMDRYANTAAASIPILIAEKEFKEDDILLLASIGSGWTYGAMLIEWTQNDLKPR